MSLSVGESVWANLSVSESMCVSLSMAKLRVCVSECEWSELGCRSERA